MHRRKMAMALFPKLAGAIVPHYETQSSSYSTSEDSEWRQLRHEYKAEL
jgi:hypothetical protein